VTYHLAGLRLRSIGERSARFADLHLDLRAPEGSRTVPSDSLIWLRNGGGKSSLLSLFYALLLPHANDFMGRAVKRSLTDYVGEGDTAHTMAVWHAVENPTLLGDPDRVLVTGAIYEWRDLHRPADADRDRDRLDISYYAFYEIPGVMEAATLPLDDPEGRPLRRAAVVEALRAVPAEYAAAMDLCLPRTQREWTDALQARGIDPELYRRQKEMNHVEGGVEDLFRFASAREFVDFLLDLTVPPDDAATIAGRLAKIADLLATKPAKLGERDFCRESALALGRVGTTHADLRRASDDLTRAEQDAAELAAGFAAAVTAAAADRDFLGAQQEAVRGVLRTARGEHTRAADLAQWYRHRAAELRVAAAAAETAHARDAVARATADAQAWRLTEHLAERADLTANLAQVRLEAGAEREDVAPLRTARDDHAAHLVTRLESLARTAEAEAEAARDEAVRRQDDSDEHRVAAQAARERLSEAAAAAATAVRNLDELDQQLRDAVAAGRLPDARVDCRRQHDLVLGSVEDRRAELASIRARRAARPAARATTTAQLTELTSRRSSVDAERTRALTERDRLSEQGRSLSEHPRIRDLGEATASAPVRLWSEGRTLMDRLLEAVRSADEALIALEAARLEDRRALDAQARTGLLPTGLDAARVLAVLTDHGVPAESGWSHLHALLPEGSLGEALRDPRLARLGCGVVVPGDRIHEATAVLEAMGTTTTALVGLYPAESVAAPVARQQAGAPAWTGLHRGLVDMTVAEAAVAVIRARTVQDDATRTVTRARRDGDRALLTALEAFLQDCPEGHLAALEERIRELDADLDRAGERLGALSRELRELDRRDAEDAVREQDLAEEVVALTESAAHLAELARRGEAADSWREHRTVAEADQARARADIERYEERQRAAQFEADRLRQSALNATSAAEAHRAEALAVEFLDGRPSETTRQAVGDDLAVPLDTLRRRYQDAGRAHEFGVSSSVLAERERYLTERLTRVEAALAVAEPSVASLAGQLVGTPVAQTSIGRAQAVRDAERARSDAETAYGRAQGEVRAAERELEAASRQRRALPARPPDLPADPQEAEEQAARQETAASRSLERSREAETQLAGMDTDAQRLSDRAKAFGFLLDDLPQPSASDTVPFRGDDLAARDAKRAVTDALRRARAAHRAAEDTLATAVSAVRAVGNRHPGVRTPARDRILHDPAEVLAADTARLASNLELRADMIDGELAGLAKDQTIVTSSLARLVRDTLDTLRRAEQHSRLPRSLGPWAGKRMLRISFDAPASEKDLEPCVDRVIERRIAEGVKAQGLPLLKDAVHEAVGRRGFTVKVLKPTADVATTSEDITRLGKWSGGEKLTVCVALYCTLAALRARNTGRGNTAGGVLMLDNPIGRASHGALVRLQREVAAAHGVQLVYTTGVKDPDAVSRFPNVIRLDNRPGRTRSRRYIVQDDAAPATPAEPANADALPSTVTGTRVAHAEFSPLDEVPQLDEVPLGTDPSEGTGSPDGTGSPPGELVLPADGPVSVPQALTVGSAR